jgi:hypothetical protein
MFYLGRIDAIKTLKKAVGEVATQAEGRNVRWGPNIFEGLTDGALGGTRQMMPPDLDEYLTLLFEAMDANGGDPAVAADAVRMAVQETHKLPGLQ